jgi:hypothetical protein
MVKTEKHRFNPVTVSLQIPTTLVYVVIMSKLEFRQWLFQVPGGLLAILRVFIVFLGLSGYTRVYPKVSGLSQQNKLQQ